MFRIVRALNKQPAIREYLQEEFGDREKLKDDFMFEEARKINIACFQNIIWNEYLPKVLGDKYMKEYTLSNTFNDYSSYDEDVNPTLLHEFSTFSYRCITLK